MDKLLGRYTYSDGQFQPDQAMQDIQRRKRDMLLLRDKGSGVPQFYWDPRDSSYWECNEFEDHSASLQPVSRDYIERQYPTVDCDSHLEVDHPDI